MYKRQSLFIQINDGLVGSTETVGNIFRIATASLYTLCNPYPNNSLGSIQGLPAVRRRDLFVEDLSTPF